MCISSHWAFPLVRRLVRSCARLQSACLFSYAQVWSILCTFWIKAFCLMHAFPDCVLSFYSLNRSFTEQKVLNLITSDYIFFFFGSCYLCYIFKVFAKPKVPHLFFRVFSGHSIALYFKLVLWFVLSDLCSRWPLVTGPLVERRVLPPLHRSTPHLCVCASISGLSVLLHWPLALRVPLLLPCAAV